MQKIDVFNHLLPKPYFDRIQEIRPNFKDIGKRVRNVPVLSDIDLRMEQMQEFGDDYYQVVTLAAPPIETVATPEQAGDLAKIGNDTMAQYVADYDRIIGFVPSLPMNNSQAMQAEIRRTIEDLGANGVQIYTNVDGKPLDRPEFEPLFEMMNDYDLPIWVHPTRGASMADYADEDRSEYEIWWTFGWPYETSAFQARMVFGGYFDKYPNLKFITHHLGGMTPYFEGRVGPGMDQLGARTSDKDLTQILKRLKKRPLEYFKDFYADTATFGSRAAMVCGIDFYGEDHVLFASDSPFDPEKGPGYTRATIQILESIDIPDETRAKIFHGNAKRLLKLQL